MASLMRFGTLFRLFFFSVICLLSCSLSLISLSLSYIGSPLPPDLTAGFMVPTLSIVTACPCQFPEVQELTFYPLSLGCNIRTSPGWDWGPRQPHHGYSFSWLGFSGSWPAASPRYTLCMQNVNVFVVFLSRPRRIGFGVT